MQKLKKISKLLFILLLAAPIISYTMDRRLIHTKDNLKQKLSSNPNNPIPIEKILLKYQSKIPKQWGEKVTGVKNQLLTKEKVVALSFDACGVNSGMGFDAKLINYLKKQKISATLFINSHWIDGNKKTFIELAKDPLFEIENHGTQHLPLSITGRKAYGIKGTKNVREVIDEIMTNQRKIKNITGRTPKFFRSGTAFYDDIAVKIANDLGLTVVGFTVLGDAGATFTTKQVVRAYISTKPGSIILSHMNQPKSSTAEGVIKAITILKKEGYQFVKLENYLLK